MAKDKAYWQRKARAAGKRHGLGEWFVRQMEHESAGFAPDVISGKRNSPAGAQGVAQIMPATAKGWGVNPLDPEAALDAAAKNMRRYVQEYGSVEKALRAYNAGPGAIEKSRGYRETNNYVKLILPGGKAEPLKAPKGTDARRKEIAPLSRKGTAPELDVQSAVVDALLAGGKNIMGSLQRNLTSGNYMTEPVQPNRSNSAQGDASTGSVSPNGKTSGGKTGGRLNVRELFHDPAGAFDEGHKIPAIGGHGKHVHAAFETKAEAIRAGKIAKQMGLHVSEQSHFDKVDPVHTKGSLHYSDRAVDASGDRKKMLAYFKKIKALGRLK